MHRQSHEARIAKQHQDGEPQQTAHQARIHAGTEGEEFVEAFEEPAKQEVEQPREGIWFRAVFLQQQRAQRRAKRERIDRGDNRRGGNRERELLIELTRDTADEGGGHEHRTEHQRYGDDGTTHFLHRLDRGIARIQAFGDVSLHVFDDDDGIIDHDPDG